MPKLACKACLPLALRGGARERARGFDHRQIVCHCQPMSRGSSLLTDGTRPDLRRDATPDTKIICAIGLMSGTSLDGVDAALLTTDGERELIPGPFLTLPYTQAFRSQLISVLGRTPREDRTQVRPD